MTKDWTMMFVRAFTAIGGKCPILEIDHANKVVIVVSTLPEEKLALMQAWIKQGLGLDYTIKRAEPKAL